MGKLKKLVYSLVLMAACFQNSYAQTPSLNHSAEYISIHTNTTVLVAGESLLFKIYCVNQSSNTLSQLSKVAYFELVDSDRKTIVQNKILLENGTGQGDYFIPTTIVSGNYKLITYTALMLNNDSSNFSETDLLIVNPFEKNLSSNAVNNIKKNDSNLSINYLKSPIHSNGMLSLSKKEYSKREKVDLKITETLPQGNYSVSVRKIDSLSLIDTTIITELPSKSTIKTPIKVLAETRGEIISGFIASKTDADLSNKYISLSIPGTNFIYKVTKTDKQGYFNFIIDQGSKSSDVVLQLLNEENKNFVIELNKTVRPDLSNLTISKSLNLSEHLGDEIELRSIANQIENNYYYKKEDSIKVSSITNPFYYGTEKEYILENYTRFPTLKETIIEYVTDLNMKSNNGNIEFYLSLANSQHEPVKQREPCLLLVDGLQIQNSKDLFNYDIKGIEKIAVVPNSYYLGPKLFNGVVSITTINQDFPAIYSGNESTKKSILRPSEPKKYFAQTYAGITKNSKVPDYRYQLLWEPNLTTQNIQQVISFYSSDITGNFEIVLEGLSEEGKVVRITKTLLIK